MTTPYDACNNSLQLLKDRKNLMNEFLEDFMDLNNSLKKLNLQGIREYLGLIETYPNPDDIILNTGKKWLGGLSRKKRELLLELYLLHKGRIRRGRTEHSVYDIHENTLALVSIIMQSTVWIQKTLSHNSIFIRSIANLLPDISKYKDVLKAEDYAIENLDIDQLTSLLQEEERLNMLLEENIIQIIQKYNSNITDYKKQLLLKYAPKISDIKFALKLGLVTLLLACALYNTSAAGANLDHADVQITQIKPGYISPLKGTYTITSLFGMRVLDRTIKQHNGIDIGCSVGTPVNSIEDGKVIKINVDPNGYGLYIMVQHNDGLVSLYAHGSKIAKNIKVGTIVQKGQQIMISGRSGRGAKPHLHLSILSNGEYINPLAVDESLKQYTLKPAISWAQKDAYDEYRHM